MIQQSLDSRLMKMRAEMEGQQAPPQDHMIVEPTSATEDYDVDEALDDDVYQQPRLSQREIQPDRWSDDEQLETEEPDEQLSDNEASRSLKHSQSLQDDAFKDAPPKPEQVCCLWPMPKPE